jgi:peroxiredoxin
VELQERLEELTRSGIGVAAISYDSQEILSNFAEERGITFPLLSDADSEVIKAYGILNTVAAEGMGPNQDDPDVIADVKKYVAVSGCRHTFPGHVHA